MRIPLSWLKDYFPAAPDAEELALALTSIGLEVEGVQENLSPKDILIDVALTPNLGHAASLMGVAKELSALLEKPVIFPSFALQEAHEPLTSSEVHLTIEDNDLCPHYSCRLIVDVTVAPSPSWLKERLEAAGLRSVNNVVDVANYVLLECGYPLHAFDLDTLEGSQIVVRRTQKGERIVTLDGKEHFPTADTLCICDAKKPIALAGIMGSAETEVSSSTKRILLEAAYFDAGSVRRASKRMGISTEASKRFERGVDPLALHFVLDRAAFLIQSIAGGKVTKGILEEQSHDPHWKRLSCRLSRVNCLLGIHLAMGEVVAIFKRLGFIIQSIKENVIEVDVPPSRHDLQGEIDLVEEVARLYGYDNIFEENKHGLFYQGSRLADSSLYLFEKKVRELLLRCGLQELLTCDLISEKEAHLVCSDCMPSRSVISLLNPCSQEQSVLRPSFLPGILKVVKNNVDHETDTLWGFEIGRVHFKAKDEFLERTTVAIVLSGCREPLHFGEKGQNVDFFTLKGLLENLFEALPISGISFQPSSYENFHPGRQAKLVLGLKDVGIIGQVHPNTLKKVGLDTPVFFAEIELEDLQGAFKNEARMQKVPQYPASSRDWTVTLKKSIPVGELLDLIESLKLPLLREVLLLDVYEGEKLGRDFKNVTFRFVYRDDRQTISQSQVESEHARLLKEVGEKKALFQ